MWLYRRNREPSVTEETCYWKKLVLATAGTAQKFIKAAKFCESIATKDSQSTLDLQYNFLRYFLEKAKGKQLDVQFTRYYFDVPERKIMCLSIHQLLIEFKETGKT